jgi:hypothetical protein
LGEFSAEALSDIFEELALLGIGGDLSPGFSV